MLELPEKNKLSISLVGPGHTSIPPKGWGAVELLIWNSYQYLTELGHSVHIINTPSRKEIINTCNSTQSDFIHIHYDRYWDIIPHLKCSSIAITSHNPYTEQASLVHDTQSWDTDAQFTQALIYDWVHKGIISLSKDKRVNIFALSDSIREVYIRDGFDPSRVVVIRNSINCAEFEFNEKPLFPERTIYLGSINKRKRQNIYNSINDIDFAGDLHDESMMPKNYIGPWSRTEVCQNLTKYPNLALLSEAEAHPLVCMEALSAGLGLVLSTASTAHLDSNKPFIDIVPPDKIYDLEYVRDTIKINRQKAVRARSSIREYAKEFDLKDSMINYDHIIKACVCMQ